MMAEEVQGTQAAADAQPGSGQEGVAPAAKKKMKINKLTAGQLSERMKELEEKKLQKSKYFKHLTQRKKELGA